MYPPQHTGTATLNDISQATRSSAAVSGWPRPSRPASSPVIATSVPAIDAALETGNERRSGSRTMVFSVKGIRRVMREVKGYPSFRFLPARVG
jgi:hypothetical protein